MTRVPETTGGAGVTERIRLRRGGTLRPIDRVLLHSPALADGWNSLLGTLRGGLDLPGALREIVALRVAVLNDAAYEWESHEAAGSREGLTAVKLAALRAPFPGQLGVFDETELLVLDLTDTITHEVAVPDELFARAAAAFETTELVELVTTIAAYNMVSRLVVAFRIQSSGSEATE
ncbi:MAG: carboxymuconolactone decarboxylase family protein [Microbacterium sp.]|uniref:carboxymuconolactone decarboxylase family protein n=1 Tax=Microbacterium sp. TaxID=51671 RepID=UPI0039E298B7